MRRVEWTRLRWRMRGAWMWPVFVTATVCEGILLNALPVWGDGPGGLLPGLLLAGCLNIILVAAVAPLVGMLLRRRRRDLPKPIASDYAGTALLGVLFVALLAGGFAHRAELQRDRVSRAATAAAVAHYVTTQEPEYRPGISRLDTVRVEPDVYRTCVPGPDDRRPLCLFVRTSQSPPGITQDSDRAPNSVYRSRGGFE